MQGIVLTVAGLKDLFALHLRLFFVCPKIVRWPFYQPSVCTGRQMSHFRMYKVVEGCLGPPTLASFPLGCK